MYPWQKVINLLMLIGCISFLACSSGGGDDDDDDGNDPTPPAGHYREEMRSFVEKISAFARNSRADFLVIPQNGQELLTESGESDGTPVTPYLNAIDGVGREDLFYGYNQDNEPTPDAERAYMIGFLDLAERNGIQALVIDYCYSHSYMDDSYFQSLNRGYISFAANHRELDNIPDYPANPDNVHSGNVTTLAQAKNFLYLINPSTFTNKDAFLTALRNTNYDLLFLDLFFSGVQLTASDIASLKTKLNGGSRLVICYMSIGEAEDYRYYWQAGWKIGAPEWIEAENGNWPGNYLVRYWYTDWQDIICGDGDSYLKRIVDAGFDGVYLDIIDAFEYFENQSRNKTGTAAFPKKREQGRNP